MSVIVGPIGLAVGATAGYFGGWVDTVLMRITDIFLSFPSLILALAFVAALGAGLENAIVAIALTAWPPIARLARAETLTLRGADYIRRRGCRAPRRARIICKHDRADVPALGDRAADAQHGGVILTAAGLGFLGLGAQPPLPEWGAMIADRPALHARQLVAGDHSRRGDPAASASPSTCSATDCATCSIPQAA